MSLDFDRSETIQPIVTAKSFKWLPTMTFASRLARANNNVEQLDSAGCAFNKLAQTYVAQMEALKRYRTGGEQKVTVQHVSVNDGGQAIVGDVVQAPRPSNRQRPTNATEALTDAPATPDAAARKHQR